jgi:hypothetical protein
MMTKIIMEKAWEKNFPKMSIKTLSLIERMQTMPDEIRKELLGSSSKKYSNGGNFTMATMMRITL